MDPGSPPGPGWTLGDDGHWKPPPFEMGGPARPAAPTAPAAPQAPGPPQAHGPWAQAGATPPPWPPPQHGPSKKNAVVIGAVLGGIALFVLTSLVAAVTLLGTNQDPQASLTYPTSSPPNSIEPYPTTTDDEDEPDTTEPETTEPETPEITEALLASQRVSEYVAGDEWRLAGAQPLPLGSTERCSPQGWNTGAESRFQTLYDHLTDGDRDGEVTINLTVYESPEDAAADKDRAGSPEWYDCQRKRIEELSGDTNPSIQAIPDDPLASGETYVESYRKGGEPVLETFHYVFVGQIRATVTYCGCTTVGLEGRQTVAREVAAALAEVQGLPAPGEGR